MRNAVAFATLLVVPYAFASPVDIVCNGHGLDGHGHQAIAGTVSVGFEFDEQSQRMAVTRGAPSRLELVDVSVTPELARGSDGKKIYEINRIDATAAVRIDLSRNLEARRLGIGGDFFRGSCAKAGTAQF